MPELPAAGLRAKEALNECSAFAAGPDKNSEFECCRPIEGFHENNAAGMLHGRRRNQMPRDEDSYFGDLIYEVWRRGGNPDNVDRDQAREFEYLGYEPDEAAAIVDRRRPQEKERED